MSGEDSVRAAFRRQAEVCTGMGSPLTARLCTLLADRLVRGGPVADRVLGWPGDPSNRADALPLRLAGALHALVIERRDPRLAALYPPAEPSDDALWSAVDASLASHAAFVSDRLDGPPQTNEPLRTAALCPGFLVVAAETGLPLVTSEIGASAGLNLHWDRFAYRFGSETWGDPRSPVAIVPEWSGPTPPLPEIRVLDRAGCDIRPVDPTEPGAEARLLSFVWADQAERLARTRAAIALARQKGTSVVAEAAERWLPTRVAAPRPGAAHVVYHSIVWQYLPPETQARLRALLEAAGARAREDAPLAWLRLEPDGSAPGAALSLTLWPGGETRHLGRADYHGRWVDWHAA